MKKILKTKIFSFLDHLLGEDINISFRYNKNQETHVMYKQEYITNGCGSFIAVISLSHEALNMVEKYIMIPDETNKELISLIVFLSISMRGQTFGNEDIDTALNIGAMSKILGFDINIFKDFVPPISISNETAYNIKFNNLEYDYTRDFALGWNSDFQENIDFILKYGLADQNSLKIQI
jgi:hypothetical protein